MPDPEAAQKAPAIVVATAAGSASADVLQRARAFADPLIALECLDTGENILDHADAVVRILQTIGASHDMQAAVYLVYACPHLNRPQEVIAKGFGEASAALALETTKLVELQRQARAKKPLSAPHPKSDARAGEESGLSHQTEAVRKMLLAFSRDLRVVMLRLASRLQTLRYFAASKKPADVGLAAEALHVFAPLANRLGIWTLKWEMEDLAFRFLEPQTYREIARLLDEKRVEREAHVLHLRRTLELDLQRLGVAAEVQGRPKHIYSIVKKMRGKSLDFDQVFDVRALRVIVPTVADCYAVLAHVHERYSPVMHEFDDYIGKPKANGYQSLHTVVRDAAGRAFEIQIRTQAMHDHAESGVAAHWAYKEAGAKGYAGVSASSAYDAKIAVLRQLLAWERDIGDAGKGLFDEHIYVFTPDAAVVELPRGATALDFAYTVHTSLGHRCRGARVDGAMVPLNTPLSSGQTVEIVAAKDGGPSRDWLNPDLGFLVGHRARTKVRAWFNALAAEETAGRGREAVEKLLQREGKTALKLEDLAIQMGYPSAQLFFEAVGKDELSLRAIETHLRPAESPAPDVAPVLIKPPKANAGRGQPGVVVVGVGGLLSQLAKCCKPVPPDDIGGFVARGKGVSVHRRDCTDFQYLCRQQPGRVVEVEWGLPRVSSQPQALYPVDIAVQASDRQGLLRDISDVFAREKINVTGVQTQSIKGVAWMTFTAEVTDTARAARAMSLVSEVAGVRSVRRK